MVAVIMPPTTPVPIAFSDPDPAPLAIAKGNTPRMKASDVIMIGRSLSRAASAAASMRLLPSSKPCLANSMMRMAFFADKPIVTRSPTWEVDVIGEAAEIGRENSADNTKWHDK